MIYDYISRFLPQLYSFSQPHQLILSLTLIKKFHFYPYQYLHIYVLQKNISYLTKPFQHILVWKYMEPNFVFLRCFFFKIIFSKYVTDILKETFYSVLSFFFDYATNALVYLIHLSTGLQHNSFFGAVGIFIDIKQLQQHLQET